YWKHIEPSYRCFIIFSILFYLPQNLLFSRGNLVGDNHPLPTISTVEMALTCSFPSSITLIVNEHVNTFDAISSSMQAAHGPGKVRISPVIVANGCKIRIAAVGVHASGRPFANSSSLCLRWELNGCQGLAYWVDAGTSEKSATNWERFLILENASGLCTVRATVTGFSEKTVISLFEEAYFQLEDAEKSLTDAVRLQLVSALQIVPETVVLYFHPEAKGNALELVNKDHPSITGDQRIHGSKFFLKAQNLGVATFHVSVQRRSRHEISSQLIKVEVYAPLRIHPDSVFLVPGASYGLSLEGGPTFGSFFEYTSLDDETAIINGSSGRLIAVSIGNTTIRASVHANGGSLISEAFAKVEVGIPSVMTLHLQSEYLCVGCQMPVFPSFPEGDLFSFYEVCKDYTWSVENDKVLNFRASQFSHFDRHLEVSSPHDNLVQQDAIVISGAKIKTRESKNLGCIQAKDEYGRSEVAACVRVAEVAQVRATTRGSSSHVAYLSSNDRLEIVIGYTDDLGYPFFEAYGLVPLDIVTNYPNVLSIHVPSGDNKGVDRDVLHLQAKDQGVALVRISINHNPQKSVYVLISVGTQLYPMNPVLYVGHILNFSITGDGINDLKLGQWFSGNESLISIDRLSGEAHALREGVTQDVEIHWNSRDKLSVKPVRKENLGIIGCTKYEVEVREAVRFTDKITIMLPATGEIAEVSVSYDDGERTAPEGRSIFLWAAVFICLILLILTVVIFLRFLERPDRPRPSEQRHSPAPSVAGTLTPERRPAHHDSQLSPHTPQPFVEYIRSTIDETPYYKREGRRRFDPQRTY
ncbi:hypothetical protein Taro_020894, partial [Colocasia esculenta]|nr:hypothetical protein [Colocasia esculenta]